MSRSSVESTLAAQAMNTEVACAEHFLDTSGKPLEPRDAVAAILVREDGRYVMQLRDCLPGIFYPGHWGCFGGAVERGEAPLDALARELHEELEFELGEAEKFTRFDFDFGPLGQSKVYRIYFEVQVPHAAFDRFILHEGRELKALAADDLLLRRRVTPYDAFAIWMHFARRSQPGGAESKLCRE